MEFMKFTGKTEEDALTEAKIALGATTDEIEYEVLEKGTQRFSWNWKQAGSDSGS